MIYDFTTFDSFLKELGKLGAEKNAHGEWGNGFGCFGYKHNIMQEGTLTHSVDVTLFVDENVIEVIVTHYNEDGETVNSETVKQELANYEEILKFAEYYEDGYFFVMYNGRAYTPCQETVINTYIEVNGEKVIIESNPV